MTDDEIKAYIHTAIEEYMATSNIVTADEVATMSRTLADHRASVQALHDNSPITQDALGSEHPYLVASEWIHRTV